MPEWMQFFHHFSSIWFKSFYQCLMNKTRKSFHIFFFIFASYAETYKTKWMQTRRRKNFRDFFEHNFFIHFNNDLCMMFRIYVLRITIKWQEMIFNFKTKFYVSRYYQNVINLLTSEIEKLVKHARILTMP